MDGKLKHGSKIFMTVQDSILPFSNSNLSNNSILHKLSHLQVFVLEDAFLTCPIIVKGKEVGCA
jgi:hypothetical protein